MKVLLDTNFVLTCVKQKIDFVEIANELLDGYIHWILPEEIIKEIQNFEDKSLSKPSLEILQDLKPTIVKLQGNDPNVDQKIIKYIQDEDIILATLDKGLKSKVDNKILTIRGKKTLAVV